MKVSSWIIALAALLVIACTSREKSNELGKKIVGEWRNIYLKIVINEADTKDSVRISECDSTNWEAMLGIKPIHTFFNADGSYKSDYYNLKDSLFLTNTGSWTIKGDTLIMNQLTPKPGIYKMKTTIVAGVSTFEGMIDFDHDGKQDDHYLGRQRKQ